MGEGSEIKQGKLLFYEVCGYQIHTIHSIMPWQTDISETEYNSQMLTVTEFHSDIFD